MQFGKMGRLIHNILKGCLRLEEFLSRSMGPRQQSLPSLSFSGRDDHDERAMARPLLEQTNVQGNMVSSSSPQNNPCPRLQLGLLVLLMLALDLVNYLFSLLNFYPEAMGEVTTAQIVVFITWEILNMSIALRVLACCPIHAVFQDKSEREILDLLLRDKAINLPVGVILALAVLLFWSGIVFNYEFAVLPTTPAWAWALDILSLLTSAVFMFWPFLLSIVAMEGVLSQLKLILEEVETKLHETEDDFEHGNHSFAYCPTVRSWVNRYNKLHVVLERFSETVSPWLALLIFLMLMELASFYYQMVSCSQDLIKHKGMENAAVVGFYITSGGVICFTLNKLSSAVFFCHHKLGPRLAILAARVPQHREYALFSSTVATYPLVVNVGTLSISPEHYFTIAAGMVTASFIAVGLSM